MFQRSKCGINGVIVSHGWGLLDSRGVSDISNGLSQRGVLSRDL